MIVSLLISAVVEDLLATSEVRWLRSEELQVIFDNHDLFHVVTRDDIATERSGFYRVQIRPFIDNNIWDYVPLFGRVSSKKLVSDIL